MKFVFVLLTFASLADGSRLKRSSALRVKPAGPLLGDLAMTADEPDDKTKKDIANDSKASKETTPDKAEPADKETATAGKESAAKEEASAPAKASTAAEKKAAKTEEDSAKTDAAAEDKEKAKATDNNSEAAKEKESAKEKAQTKKVEPAKEKEVSKDSSDATTEKADAKKDEPDSAKEKAEVAKRKAEATKEEPDATKKASDAATNEKASKAAVDNTTEKSSTDESKKEGSGSKDEKSAEAAPTTSTTLSVFDAPKVQQATTTAKPVSNETLSDYMRECAKQLKAIVKKAEAHYTHQQLVVALRQECDLDKEFPTVREVFFDHRRDCRQFAEDLGAAREAELKGATNAYDQCCRTAWEEKSQAVGLPLASAMLALVLAWMM